MVWLTLGSRTAKEQNTTEQSPISNANHNQFQLLKQVKLQILILVMKNQ